MTSPEKIASNRRNARKSTGPKTSEGKTRSSRNAVTHGLTAGPETCPGDPTGAFRDSLAEWVGDQKPRGIVQRTLAERACRAAWNLRRCDRYEDATTAKRNRDAAEKHDLAESARVEAIGRRLVAMPAGTAGDARAEGEDPAALVGELRTTAAGVAWLLARWAELGRALGEPGGWDEARRYAAIRLLGVGPEAARDHPAARKIPSPTADPGADWPGGSVFDEPEMSGLLEAAVAAGRLGEGDPKTLWNEAFLAIADRAGRGANPARAAARFKGLKALVRSERAKLARLLTRGLKARAAEDRAGAADRTLFDEGRSLSLCLRYATAASRDLHRTIADFDKLRKAAEGKESDEGPDPTGPEPGMGSPPNIEANLRNEPKIGPAPRQAPGSTHQPQSETRLKVTTPRPSRELVPTPRVGMSYRTLRVALDVSEMPTRSVEDGIPTQERANESNLLSGSRTNKRPQGRPGLTAGAGPIARPLAAAPPGQQVVRATQNQKSQKLAIRVDTTGSRTGATRRNRDRPVESKGTPDAVPCPASGRSAP